MQRCACNKFGLAGFLSALWKVSLANTQPTAYRGGPLTTLHEFTLGAIDQLHELIDTDADFDAAGLGDPAELRRTVPSRKEEGESSLQRRFRIKPEFEVLNPRDQSDSLVTVLLITQFLVPLGRS